MTAAVNTDTGDWWSFRQEGNVGVWQIKDWEQLFETEIAQAEAHFNETASRADITASLVVFDEVGTLSSEMQDHITEAWSGLAQAVELERTAYVADGITAMAVKSNVRAPNTEIDSFESEQRALEWAKEG